jgi:phosphoglycerol transferase MdoB-like AlkP superfamily enzyme
VPFSHSFVMFLRKLVREGNWVTAQQATPHNPIRDRTPVMPALSVWLRVMLLLLGLLFVWRGLYAIVFRADLDGLPPRDLLNVLLVGLRFDISTALITVVVPTVLLWIPGTKRVKRSLALISSWFMALVAGLAFIVLWSDLLFCADSGHHLTVEPSGVRHDILPMLLLVWREYPLPLLVLLICTPLLMWAVRKQFRPLLENDGRPQGLWNHLLTVLVITAVTIIGIRGGLQKEPLKGTDALFSSSYRAANVCLNGWYSYLTSAFKERGMITVTMPEADAEALTRRLVARPDDRFLSPDFPLLRRSEPHGSLVQNGERLNIVLIIVESLNASYLQSFGGPRSVMPFLDSLSRQSLIFTNCEAFATRSFRGVSAILASVPNLESDPHAFIVSLPRLRGLGDVLREQGYRVRFMHAAAPGSMGIMAICRLCGYEDFESDASFPKGAFDGSWGVWDHISLMRMSTELDSLREPFHYGLFTLSTHAPWRLPPGYPEAFSAAGTDAEVLNTYAYLDGALRAFFRREVAQPRFDHTLYVIVGDHTTRSTEDDRFRIGCLFYAPGRLKPAVDERPISQLDLLPTILDLAGIIGAHASFGRSALEPDTLSRLALSAQSDQFNWRHGRRILVSDGLRDIALFDAIGPRDDAHSLLARERATADTLRREMQAFCQTARMLVRDNRLLPPRPDTLALSRSIYP